jgi:hypothetical protein
MTEPDPNPASNAVARLREHVGGLVERAEGQDDPEMPESVATYAFLRKEFNGGPIAANPLFQFIYRSFYRMENAGLTWEFHKAYFGLMDELRRTSQLDLKKLLLGKLYEIATRKAQHSIQFSFVSKLAHTINPDRYPIYDSKIATAFNFSPPYTQDSEIRAGHLLRFYEDLQTLYREVLQSGDLEQTIGEFRKRYTASTIDIPDIKILDFIFWSAGKQIESDRKNH